VGPQAQGGLKLRDVLRADVPAIYGALARDAAGRDRLVRRLYRLVHWLEHGSKRDVRAYLVTPLPLLWAWHAGDGSWASQIHKRYLRALWGGSGLTGRAMLVLALLAWLPIVLAMAAWSTWLNGRAIRQRAAKGVARQLAEQIWFAGRHGLLPLWYYMFEMFDPAQQAKAPHYVHRYELKSGLLQILRRSVEAKRRSAQRRLRRCAVSRRRGRPRRARRGDDRDHLRFGFRK
jgi:hypothetical protein